MKKLNFERIKRITYISGALFSSLTLLSGLFKTLHLQGATFLLIAGLMGLALVFIPAFAIYKYFQ
jgi:hypothetical protein|tara:strand:- start:1458 stop:1652 length:195 start_codon:yes stop_codon:yes gene_type:complete